MATELKTRDFVLVPEGSVPARDLISQTLRSGVKKRFIGASGRELSVVAYSHRVTIEDTEFPEEFNLEGGIDFDSMATFNLHTRRDEPHPTVPLVKGRHPDMRAMNFVRFMLSEYFPEQNITRIPAHRSWWWGSSDNYQQFREACTTTGDLVSAVKNTVAGRISQELGYSEVYPETIHQGEKEHIHQGRKIIEPFILVDFYKDGTPYEDCLKPINPWLLRDAKS